MTQVVISGYAFSYCATGDPKRKRRSAGRRREVEMSRYLGGAATLGGVEGEGGNKNKKTH
eukprot:5210867-Prymnesium_polylepis.1